jgi:biopolymer transport protein ExbD
MSFRFAPARSRRRPSLTPMIDVVFLLLVFFMLAARFGQEGALDLRIASTGTDAWQGPPRLVQIDTGTLRLNGRTYQQDALFQALTGLTETQDDLILIEPGEDVDLQRLLDVMAALREAEFTSLALVAR